MRDLWLKERGWDWLAVGDRMSNSNLMRLALVTLTPADEEGDRMGWLSVNGSFTVSSAYNLHVGSQGEEPPW